MVEDGSDNTTTTMEKMPEDSVNPHRTRSRAINRKEKLNSNFLPTLFQFLEFEGPQKCPSANQWHLRQELRRCSDCAFTNNDIFKVLAHYVKDHYKNDQDSDPLELML